MALRFTIMSLVLSNVRRIAESASLDTSPHLAKTSPNAADKETDTNAD